MATTFDRFIVPDFDHEQERLLERDLRNIRRLVYLYFILLIIEGAIRKWIVPQLSGPLLIIRDPVVILAYFLALRSRIFPWNVFVVSGGLLGIASLIAGLFASENTLVVALYGFRTDFLQMPFLFLMARVLRREDLVRLGKWILFATIPMAILMLVQYVSPSTAFINTVPGGGGEQIAAMGDHIRPPGPFSFITGVAEFFSLAIAFVLASTIYRHQYPLILLLLAIGSLVLGTIVSISRLALFSEAIVIFAFCVTSFFHPGMILKIVLIALLSGILFLLFNKGGLTADAVDIFSERVEAANNFEQQTGTGTATRISLMFTEPLLFMEQIPWLGYGLGIGTNAGATLATGRTTTVEGEWARLVMESGPLLGCALIVWRVWLLGYLLRESFKLCLRGHVLPLLLWAAAAQLLLIGQWGRPTTLGFCIFSAGLCLTTIALLNRPLSAESGDGTSPA